jgi:hypothetical protein
LLDTEDEFEDYTEDEDEDEEYWMSKPGFPSVKTPSNKGGGGNFKSFGKKKSSVITHQRKLKTKSKFTSIEDINQKKASSPMAKNDANKEQKKTGSKLDKKKTLWEVPVEDRVTGAVMNNKYS